VHKGAAFALCRAYDSVWWALLTARICVHEFNENSDCERITRVLLLTDVAMLTNPTLPA